MINIIVPFENRIKYHEGFILRTLLGLKIVYGANLNLIILTSKNKYVDVIYNNRFRRIKSLATVMTNKSSIRMYNTSNYITILSSKDHPDYSYFKSRRIEPKILSSLYEEELEDSLIYKNKFSFPDLSEIDELIDAPCIRSSFILEREEMPSLETHLTKAIESMSLKPYLDSVVWKDNNEKKYNTPIILIGFVRRQDGIGSHLPNLYDNIFNEYENVSFSINRNRWAYHFAFLNDMYSETNNCKYEMNLNKRFNKKTQLQSESVIKYYKDFEWIKKWEAHEDCHIWNPDKFKGAHVLSVGGFGGELDKEYEETRFSLNKFRKQFNCKMGLYLMWESEGIDMLGKIFSLYDYIVVTNTWLRNRILEVYPNKDVRVVEHIARYYDVPSHGSKTNFTFGFSGGLWERKKVDVILKAFSQTRNNTDILKIHTRESVNNPDMINKFNYDIKQYGIGVEFINKTLADKEYTDWWNSLNCYVFISAGESYSVTPRQALMQGTPVILSKNTSHLDLLDIPGILWVDCEEKNTAEFSGNPVAGIKVGMQFEPIEAEVVKCMREVKNNYARWKRAAVEGAKELKKRTSADNIKQQWRDILINEK